MPGSVAIIGAGLGGLSTAIRLAASGFQVEVFDRQQGPGGKAFSEYLGGYRFDTGPSLFTMRWVFEELFRCGGAELDDYLKLEPLSAICNYFWDDGQRFTAYGDPERFAREVEQRFGEPRAHIEAYLEYSRQIFDIAGELFLEHSLHEARTFFSRRFWSSLFRVGSIDALRTMDQANGSFVAHPRLRQLLNRYATYNGSSPYHAPATLNIIPYVEYVGGAYAVHGGIYAVPRAMERLARQLGVRFHYDTKVERILSRKRRPGRFDVTGIRVAGEDLPYEVVVSNVDVTPTYEELLEDTEAPLYKRYRRLEPSSSGLVFYWGMRRSFSELGLHNIFFSEDYRREFRRIFHERLVPDDPTVYVNIGSKVDPRDAPEGAENWFVLVNVPPDTGQDWETARAQLREVILTRVGRILGVDLESEIDAEGSMTPPEIQAKTGSAYGSLYGISSNSRGAAFLRHRNRSTRYRGLYLAGGSAHPGGGMPLVVLSGKITAELIAS